MTSFNISTVGCQMNVSDSEKLSSSLVKMGFESQNSYEDSSIIVVNTCVVRQSAEDTTTGFLGKLRKIKSINNHDSRLTNHTMYMISCIKNCTILSAT